MTEYFVGSPFLGPFIAILTAAEREESNGGLRQVDIRKGRGESSSQ